MDRLLPPLAVAAFLLLAFSGCLGGAGGQDVEASGSPTGSVEATHEQAPPAQVDEATGAVEGRVVNENQAPIATAYVILVGSRNATTTDREGRFTLSHVLPGEYTLRVDADTYRPIEHPVRVLAAQVARLNITLAPLVDRGAGYREHLHDLWGDQGQKVLFDGQVNYEQSLASGGRQGNDYCIYNPQAGTPVVHSGNCPRPLKFHLPGDVIVYPGTAQLSVKVAWTSQYVTEVGFRFIPANESSVRRAPLMLKNAEERTIAVEYPMTDHGHQTYSMWSFELVPDVRVANYRVVSQSDFNRRNAGPFHVTLTAHRGVIPAEPAHPVFWTNSSEIIVADKLEKTITGLPTATKDPKDTSCAGLAPCFVLPAGSLIPPGTTRVKVTLDISYGSQAAAALFGEKSLAFRTSKTNPRDATFADLRVETPQGSGLTRTYELKLEPGEADAFYQKKSLWAFFLANQGQEREERFFNECFNFFGAGCGDSRYRLSVMAINDDFEPEE